MTEGDRRSEPRYSFARFADERVSPFARIADERGELDRSVILALKEEGYLGAMLPEAVQGRGMDQATYGILTGEIGRACSAARTLMTVHGLVITALWRWGREAAKSGLIPALAEGRLLAAFALSEPGAGSDAAAVKTTVARDGGDVVLSGEKSWISFGLLADIFLVFGKAPEGMTAVLVPGDCRGLSRRPVPGMTGTRGAMMADLCFDGCRVPAENIVGAPGFGLSHVAVTALDFGRYSVAWGAVGIADAALRACLAYAGGRDVFAKRLADHPLMQARLSRLAVNARAARLLCTEAGRLRDIRSPAASAETMAAKYFASKTAVAAANEAVQVHGARGLLAEYGMERLLRDAKVTEIIEGNSDLMEILLSRYDLED